MDKNLALDLTRDDAKFEQFQIAAAQYTRHATLRAKNLVQAKLSIFLAKVSSQSLSTPAIRTLSGILWDSDTIQSVTQQAYMMITWMAYLLAGGLLSIRSGLHYP